MEEIKVKENEEFEINVDKTKYQKRNHKLTQK